MQGEMTKGLGKRMLIGGLIGLTLIAILLFDIVGKPEWGDWWKLRPHVIVTLAGACGGACNYFILKYKHLISLPAALACILSFLVFIVGLWLGTVLGLDGTLWN